MPPFAQGSKAKYNRVRRSTVPPSDYSCRLCLRVFLLVLVIQMRKFFLF